MEIFDLFELLATVLNWVKMVLTALGLEDNEFVSKFLNNLDNAQDIIDTEPNTATQ